MKRTIPILMLAAALSVSVAASSAPPLSQQTPSVADLKKEAELQKKEAKAKDEWAKAEEKVKKLEEEGIGRPSTYAETITRDFRRYTDEEWRAESGAIESSPAWLQSITAR